MTTGDLIKQTKANADQASADAQTELDNLVAFVNAGVAKKQARQTQINTVDLPDEQQVLTDMTNANNSQGVIDANKVIQDLQNELAAIPQDIQALQALLPTS